MKKRIVIPTYGDRHMTKGWEIPFESDPDISILWYEKDDSLSPGEVIEMSDGYRIPNFGRSSYAFLHHIVKNYDSLAEYEVFTKTHLWRQRIEIARTVQQCHEYEHLQAFNTMRAFVYMRDALHFQDFLESLVTLNPGHRIERTGPRNATVLLAQVIPPALETIRYGTSHGAGLQDSPLHSLYFAHDLPPQDEEQYHQALSEIFPGFALPLPYCFRRENVWSVSGRLIRQHPRSIYENMISKIEQGDQPWEMCHDEWCVFWPLFWDETIRRMGEIEND